MNLPRYVPSQSPFLDLTKGEARILVSVSRIALCVQKGDHTRIHLGSSAGEHVDVDESIDDVCAVLDHVGVAITVKGAAALRQLMRVEAKAAELEAAELAAAEDNGAELYVEDEGTAPEEAVAVEDEAAIVAEISASAKRARKANAAKRRRAAQGKQTEAAEASS